MAGSVNYMDTATQSSHNIVPWYPAVEPGWNPKNYAYYYDLKGYGVNNQYAKTTRDYALDALNKSHSNLTVQEINTAFDLLNQLWQSERKKEIDFLTNILKLNYEEVTRDTKSFINAINVLQNKGLFQSSVNYIKRLEEQTTGGWLSHESDALIHALFEHMIPDEITKVVNAWVENNSTIVIDEDHSAESVLRPLNEQISIAVVNLLQKELTRTFDRDEKDQAEIEREYRKLMDFILDEANQNQFLEQILKNYGLDLASIVKSYYNKNQDSGGIRFFNPKTQEKEIKFAKIQGAGGFAFETFSHKVAELIANGLNAKSADIKVTPIHTGSWNQMKADELLAFYSEEINISEMEENFNKGRKSVGDNRKQRAQNIEGMANMNKKLHDVTLVEISEKNYLLTGEAFNPNGKNGYGFKAQDKVKMDSLSSTLARSKFATSATISDIIFILVNSGTKMINSNYDDVIEYLQYSIASMLFDDVAVNADLETPKSNNLNTIHVFNLNNIFVPLSVFLEGLYKACDDIKDDLKNWVSIKFVSASKTPNTEDSANGKSLTKEDWTAFYDFKYKNNYLNIHFFGNFINWVREHLG